MRIIVDWPATAAAAAGIWVLLGYAWLRRGHRAVGQAGIAVGVWRLTVGATTGNVIEVGAGVIVLAVVGWCLWYIREPRREGRSR